MVRVLPGQLSPISLLTDCLLLDSLLLSSLLTDCLLLDILWVIHFLLHTTLGGRDFLPASLSTTFLKCSPMVCMDFFLLEVFLLSFLCAVPFKEHSWIR